MGMAAPWYPSSPLWFRCPPLGSAACRSKGVLDTVTAQFLDQFEDRLLAPPAVFEWRKTSEKVVPYLDVVLRRDREAYELFLDLLWRRGLLGVCTRPRGRVTPFFREKEEQQAALGLRLQDRQPAVQPRAVHGNRLR